MRAFFWVVPVLIILSGTLSSEPVKRVKLSEETYTNILSEMLYLQSANTKKYKVSETDPSRNRSTQGAVNAEKFSRAMSEGRKRIFSKFGISESEFTSYSERLDNEAITPDGAAKKERILRRAAERARSKRK